jgi:hypothetical protein
VLLPDLQLRGSLTPSQDDAEWDTDLFEVRGAQGLAELLTCCFL